MNGLPRSDESALKMGRKPSTLGCLCFLIVVINWKLAFQLPPSSWSSRGARAHRFGPQQAVAL